jgi:S-adenosylmethionine decarboxylase
MSKEITTNFGEHLIFDGYGCDYESLKSMEVCYDVLNELVNLAEMHKITEPIIIKSEGNLVLGGKDPGGFTGAVFIEESHITIHTFAKRGFVTIDLYSCKEFNTTKIIDYLNNKFNPKDKDILHFKRGMKYPTDNIYD